MARKHRYTVFDLMDDRGVFDNNPANASCPQYKGPVEYPKVLYHPKGETVVTVKSEVVMRPWGPEKLAEQREMVTRLVQNLEEEEEWKAKGWHDRPALAIAASGAVPPPTVTQEEILRMEREQRELAGRLAAAKAALQVGKKSAA